MRSFLARGFLAVSVVGCVISTAFAALLGVMPGFPSLVTDQTGTTTFAVSSTLFSVQSSPLAIRFSPTGAPQLVSPAGSSGLQLLTIDIQVGTNGMILGGHPGEDLYIVGQVTDPNSSTYSGVLLTGEIARFGFEDSGTATDQYDFRFTLTGGLLAPLFNNQDIGVTLVSEDSTFNGSFGDSFSGKAKGVVGPIPLLTVFEGCTPGYWKQPHHFESWPLPYTPNTLFESVFAVDVPGNPTLVEVLRIGGGGLNALMRHATAALLNAANNSVYVDPAFNATSEVISAFSAAYNSGDYEPTKNLLEASNEQGCPLD